MDLRQTLEAAGLAEDRIRMILETLPSPDASRWNPDPTYLRSLLDRAGISQRRAAELLGINSRQMRHFCTGKLEAPYAIQFGLEVLAFLKNEGFRNDSTDEPEPR